VAGRFHIAVVVAAFALGACGWTQYGGNAGHTGRNAVDATLTTTDVGHARELWHASLSPVGPAVVANNTVYAASDGFVRAWPVRPTQCTGTPTGCPPAWFASLETGATSAPVVEGDTLYVAGADASAWKLAAYDARGRGDCTSQPAQGCLPEWTATWGSRSGGAEPPLVTVASGTVFVQTKDLQTHFSEVHAFDASGTTHCSGTPRTCSARFRTMPFVQPLASPPAIDDGHMYVPTATAIAVFDAAGVVGCVDGTCNPRSWLLADPAGGVAVGDGTAYAVAYDRLSAFDVAHCADGAFCEPVWNATLSGPGNGDAPIIAGDLVFANGAAGAIEAFDRTGGPDCSSTLPRVCPRRFASSAGATFDLAHASANAGLLIVASGTAPDQSGARYELSFFDLSGSIGCSPSTKTCDALATVPLGDDASGLGQIGQPAIASGVVVVPYLLRAFQVVGLP
jgi:hypothetical protein